MASTITSGKYTIRPINAPPHTGLFTGFPTCPFPETLPITVGKPSELWDVVVNAGVVTVQSAYAKCGPNRAKWFRHEGDLYAKLKGEDDIQFTFIRAEPNSQAENLWIIHSDKENEVLTYNSQYFPTLKFQTVNENDKSSQIFEAIPLPKERN